MLRVVDYYLTRYSQSWVLWVVVQIVIVGLLAGLAFFLDFLYVGSLASFASAVFSTITVSIALSNKVIPGDITTGWN